MGQTAAADDVLPPGTAVGEYLVEGVIGQGGMGTVYAAHHPVIGKKAAIKVISPELSANRSAVERFVLEARAVNQIGDPNIVDVFAFGALADGRSYFVMERLFGESLASRMSRERIAPLEALGFLDDIAGTLAATHAAGIIHRDLKPDNVFLCGSGVVKLLDFGVAKLAGSGDNRVERTRTGMVVGTPLYLSPEQAAAAPIDERADVYSLGVIAYELLVGRPPFLADSAVQLMAMHISAPAAPLRTLWPSVPPALDHLVMAMLAKRAADRPSLLELRQTLALVRSSISVTSIAAAAYPSRPLTITLDRPPSRGWGWGFAMVVGVLGVAGAIAGVMNLRRDEAPAPVRQPAEVVAPRAEAEPKPIVEAEAKPPDEIAPPVEVERPQPARKRRPARPKPPPESADGDDLDAVGDPFEAK
jgi:serine/threonine protein kinase